MKGKSIFLFTILALCLQIVKNEKCGPGCLACGPSACEICDSEKFYILSSSGTCVQKIIDNCEVPSTDLEEIVCFQCLPGFVLNQNGKTCQEIPQKYMIANCERYHWDYSCLTCKTKYFINDERKCEESSNEIANCDVYLDPKVCSKCSPGYFFNIGAGECQTITEISKCKVYSSIKCERCATGYFQPEDLSSGKSLSGEFLQALVSYNKSAADSKIYENSPINNCALGSVPNCETHLSYDSCKTCEDGYFLNFDKKCVEFPNRSISFCAVYENSETCAKCQPGYYLENNKCFDLNTNDGCLEFNTILEKCDKCSNETHFLSSGDCHIRLKSNNVSFCKELNQNADECQLCVLSFILTDDKLKCLPFIPHCDDYVSDPTDPNSLEFTNINTIEHICETCETGFYLMESKRKCVPQDKIGCQSFDPNTNDCNTCALGYYLESESCLRNTATNCKTYSITSNACDDCLVGYFLNGSNCQKYTAKNCSSFKETSDECESCNLGFKMASDSTQCLALTAINCKGNVDAQGECEDCHQGYYLKSGNCLPVTHRNCLQTSATDNTCAVCETGYFLNAQSLCERHTALNCKTFTTNANSCLTCDAVNYYKSGDNCLKYTIKNCKIKNTSSDECDECEDGYYIDSNKNCILNRLKHCEITNIDTANNTCQTCNDGYVVKNGLCIEVNIPGCVQYNQDKCAKCRKDLFFNTTSESCEIRTQVSCKEVHDTKDECTKCFVGFELSTTGTCEHQVINNCREYVKNSSTEPTNNRCQVCSEGYYPDSTKENCVKQSFPYCAQFSVGTNTCLNCISGYKFNSDSSACEAIAYVPGCSSYDKKTTPDTPVCVECRNGLKLSTSNPPVCEPFALVDGCIDYIINSDKCKSCAYGKKINATNDACEDVNNKSNCLSMEYNSDKCKVCLSGYYVDSSGDCQAQSVANCLTYKQNMNLCQSCQTGYIVVDETGFCEAFNRKSIEAISNCLHYDSDYENCSVCDFGFYSSEGKCHPQSVEGCATYHPNMNTCQYCHINYIENGTNCQLRNQQPNCLVFKNNSNDCEVCDPNFMLDTNTKRCFARGHFTIEMDHDFDGGTTPNEKLPYDDKCYGNRTEIDATITTMDDTSNLTANKCSICLATNKPSFNSNKYVLTKAANATFFTAANDCEKANSTFDSCELCAPLNSLTGTAGALNCTLVTSFSSNGIDCTQLRPNLTAATVLIAGADCHPEPTNGGTICKDPKLAAEYVQDIAAAGGNPAYKTADCKALIGSSYNFKIQNCDHLTSSDGTMISCKKCSATVFNKTTSNGFYDCANLNLVGSTNTAAPTYEATCLANASSLNTTDTTKIDCTLCQYGKNGPLCAATVNIKAIVQFGASADKYMPISQTDTTAVSSSNRIIFTKLDNTVKHDVGCATTYFPVTVRESATKTQVDFKSNSEANKIYVSFFRENDKMTCTELQTKIDAYNTSDASFMLNSSGTSSFMTTPLDCKSFYLVENFKTLVNGTGTSGTVYGCTACIKGKFPTKMELTDKINDTATTNTFIDNGFGFPFNYNPSTCTAAAAGITTHSDIGDFEFTTNMSYGVGYHPSNTDTINMRSIIGFSGCENSKEMLVFGFIQNKYLLFTDFTLSHHQDGNEVTIANFPPMICIDITSEIFESPGTSGTIDFSTLGIENCQIHLLETSKVSNGVNTAALTGDAQTKSFVVADGKDEFSCLACKPGYKPTTFDSTTGTITVCTQISNCSNTSTWPNACSECDNNYSWKYDKTNGNIFYNECIDSSKVSNCLIYYEHASDPTLSECTYCKTGYILSDAGQCEDPALTSECTTAGISYLNNFDASQNENSLVDFLNYFYSQRISNDVSDGGGVQLSPYCQACSSSTELMKFALGTQCTNNVQLLTHSSEADPIDKAQELSPNFCRTFDSTTQTLCTECITGYTLLLETFASTSGYCYENSTLGTTVTNCKVGVRSSSDLTFYCKECGSGYLPSPVPLASHTSATSIVCHDVTNCLKVKVSDNTCDVCKENMEYQVSFPNCNPASGTPTNTDCTMQVHDGSCLKCNGSNHFPFTLKIRPEPTNTDIVYSSECIDQAVTNISAVTRLNEKYFGVRAIFDSFTGLSYDYTYFESLNDSSNQNTGFDTDSSGAKEFATEGLRYNCINWPTSFKIDNCVDYDSDTMDCLRCDEGFLLEDNTAVGVNLKMCSARNYPLLNCAKYDDNKVCLACQPGYTLNTTRSLCTKVTSVANCALYTAETNNATPTCSYCQIDFFKDGTDCSSNDMTSCLVKNYDAKTCKSCFPGYVLYNGNCYLNIAPNCQTPDKNTYGLCEECNFGYENVNGSCIPREQNSPLCMDWDLNGNCLECIPPYSLYDGVCESNSLYQIEGCLQYHSSKVQCAECVESLILSDGFCIPPANIPNCLLKSEISNMCLGCEEGHFLLAGSCFVRKFSDCGVYSPNSDECLSCLPSYLLSSEKRCVPRTAANCKFVHGSKDECITCNDGYYLDKNSSKCVEHNALGCKTRANFSNKCQSCNEGSYLTQDGSCIPHTLDNCEIPSEYSDNCVKCTDNHYLKRTLEASDGDSYVFSNCLPYTALDCKDYDQNSDNCISCYEGYILYEHTKNTSSSTVDCIKIEKENCLNRSPSDNSCISCISSHFLKDGNCFPRKIIGCSRYSIDSDACESCPIGFYLQQNKCYAYTAKNCDTYNASYDLCESCNLGFYLSNGRCLQITHPNCKSVSTSGNECLSCENNFYLQKGNCLPYNVICETYDPYSNTCLGCPSSRYLQNENSLCVPYSTKNCSIFHPYLDECLSCVDLHYLTQGQCLPYSVSSCKAYHPNYDECVACFDGFYHRKNNCHAYNVENCSSFSSYSDNCVACLEGHYLKDGNCLPYTIENCKLLNQFENSCEECEHKYYKQFVENSLYICLPNDSVDNCLTYSGQQNSCDLCEEGFYVNLETNECVKNPDAIAGCAEYNDSTHCGVCSPPYYLTSSICKESTTIINNCEIYKSDSICQKCEDRFLLSENQKSCDDIKEFSCETYKDPENCKTCAGNQVISFYNTSDNSYTSGVNGQTNANIRAVCIDSGINGCVKAIEDFPENKCLVCDNLYYLDDFDKCQTLTERVDNCEVHFSNGICSQCLPNYVLSLDKTECSYNVSFLGPNCQEGKFVAEPNCFLCEKGYYLNDSGNCEKCQMDGCNICLPETPNLCKLCMSGYFMNSDFSCVEDTTTPVMQDSGLEMEDRECDHDKSISILQYSFLILIISLLKRFE